MWQVPNLTQVTLPGSLPLTSPRHTKRQADPAYRLEDYLAVKTKKVKNFTNFKICIKYIFTTWYAFLSPLVFLISPKIVLKRYPLQYLHSNYKTVLSLAQLRYGWALHYPPTQIGKVSWKRKGKDMPWQIQCLTCQHFLSLIWWFSIIKIWISDYEHLVLDISLINQGIKKYTLDLDIGVRGYKGKGDNKK